MEKTTSIEQDILEKSLQSLSESANGKIQGVFSFSHDFPAFNGHFPAQPVLPAVVQVAAARLLAEKFLGKELVPVNLDRAKFKTMVGPGDPVVITISLDQVENDVTISFSIAREGKKVSSGEMICRI